MNAGLDLRANEPVKLTTTPVRQAWRYWLALGAVMAAAVARLAMGPLLGNGLPFLAFYPAVAIAAMVAGWQAGIAATFISALIADCFFIVPRQNLLPGDTAGLVSLLIFVAAGLTISGTAALLSWARGRERHAAAILSADLDTMSRLQKIGALFVSGGNLEPVLGEIVETAIAISNADFGNIQVLNAEGHLRIAAQRGFPDWWVDFWNSVTGTKGACGTALERGERVIIDDIEQSPIFDGTPELEVQQRAGVRAVQSTPLMSRSGKLLGMFSTHYRKPHRPDERSLRLLDLLARQAADIIERARAEQEVRAKEAELELILARTPFMLTRCSRDLRYRYVSRAYADMLGLKPSDIAGKKIVEVMGEKGFATIRPHVETVLKGQAVDYEAEVEFASRGPRQLAVRYEPDKDERGEVIGWIASVVDFTERRRAEQQLDRSQKTFFELVDRAPFGIYLVDSQFRIVHMNAGSQTGAFRNVRPVIGRDFAEAMRILWPEPVAADIIRILRHTLETGEPYYSRRFTQTRRDSPMVESYEWELHRTTLPDGQHGVICYYFDSTKLREAEEVLTRSKEELEALVADRTAKLRELVAELEHFSYTITHDMRAPLRAMRGFAEVLNEMNAQNPDGEQKAFLERIIVAAERMDSLIADALTYSRAVRQELPLETIDVGALVRGMVDTYPEFQSSRADINIERDIPSVVGNQAALTQCFSNLLGNAVKFVRPGQRPAVRVWGERRDDRVRLWVEDNGIGISGTMLPRVFEMFSRGSSPHVGTGIGLALVRKVVDRMGGKVGVESQPGQGARFWVELKSGDALRSHQPQAQALAALRTQPGPLA